MLPLCESQRLSSTQKCYIASTIVAIALIVLSFQNLNAAQFQGIGTIGSTMCLGAGALLILGLLFHALKPKQNAPTVYPLKDYSEAQLVKKVLIDGTYLHYTMKDESGVRTVHLAFGKNGDVVEGEKVPDGYTEVPQDLINEMIGVGYSIDMDQEYAKGKAFIEAHKDQLGNNETIYQENGNTIYVCKQGDQLQYASKSHRKPFIQMEILVIRKKLSEFIKAR